MIKFIGLLFIIFVLFSSAFVVTLNWYSLRMEFNDPGSKFFPGVRDVEIIAHRGGSLERPENTHMAFSYVAKNFPDAIIELDARVTSDNHLVVMHDDTLDRTTNGSGKVSSSDMASVAKLNAGHNFEFGGAYPYRQSVYAQLLVPKLGDVFKKYRNRMIVELKGNLDEQLRAVNALIRLIDELKEDANKSYENGVTHNQTYADNVNSLEGRFIVSSELFLPIYKIRKRKPNWLFAPTRPEIAYKLIPLSKLGFVRADAPIELLFKLKSDVYCLPRRYRGKEVITKTLIDELNRRKKPLYAWTINDEEEMEELIKMGVKGIITDRPGALRRVIFRLSRQQ